MGFRMPKWIVDFTGKVHVSKQPPFVIYNPKFHLLKGKEIRQIFNIMKPGDIFLRRHNGYVSGLAIPGYWTHAALFIGDNMVAHATAKGVISEDVLDFFRCDCTALVRVKKCTPQMISKAVSKARFMIKRNLPYDYEFSDENGKIYCTELIDIVYDYIFANDYTKDIGGGVSILPDGVFSSKVVKCLLDFRH